MGCYYALWYNTHAFSLLFHNVYMKRENAGSWNSGLEKGANIRDLFYTTPKILKLHGEQGWRARPTPWARCPSLWGPWQAPNAHLLLYGVF